jgi:hypothetical protein
MRYFQLHILQLNYQVPKKKRRNDTKTRYSNPNRFCSTTDKLSQTQNLAAISLKYVSHVHRLQNLADENRMESTFLRNALGVQIKNPKHIIEILALIAKEILRWGLDVLIFLVIVIAVLLCTSESTGNEARREEVLGIVRTEIMDRESVDQREEMRRWFEEGVGMLDIGGEHKRDEEEGKGEREEG